MFGLFRKSRFPKFKLGAKVGRYEAKGFLAQRKIKLDWAHGPEPLAMFVPWLVQNQLDYYRGVGDRARVFGAGVTSYLDAPAPWPVAAPGIVWEITETVTPENYLSIGGTWHDNAIGSTMGSIGGPAGPEADTGRIEIVKALIHRTGPDPRTVAAIRHVIAFHTELGSEEFAKTGARVQEAWRLATA